MAQWRHQQRAADFMGALIEGGNKLIRRRPVDLGTFLAGLDGSDAARLLGSTEGRRDARHHLDANWNETVDALARPESLPEVVERRARTRVHPLAPWFTAGVAGAGGGVVVAGSQPMVLEVLAVAAVVGGTAVASSPLWRPRAARKDKRYTVSGAPALLARAEALVSQQSVGDLGALRGADRLLAAVQGNAHEVDAAESRATVAGLTGTDGRLLPEAQLSPAQRDVVNELLLQRAELVQGVLQLQRAVLRIDEDDRRMRREEYRRIVEDLNG